MHLFLVENHDQIIGAISYQKGEGSLVSLFGESGRSFLIKAYVSECFVASHLQFVYYDYSRDCVGLVNTQEERIVWEIPTAKSRNLDYVGFDDIGKNIILQGSGNIQIINPNNGELVQSLKEKRKLIFYDEDLRIFRKDKIVTLESPSGSRKFSMVGSSPHVYRFGNSIGLVERQGLIRICDLRNLSEVFSLPAEKGSEFSRLFVSEDAREIIVTQHYFDKPDLTFVNQIYRFDDIDYVRDVSVVKYSGRYAMANKGRSIHFSDRIIYTVASRTLEGI